MQSKSFHCISARSTIIQFFFRKDAEKKVEQQFKKKPICRRNFVGRSESVGEEELSGQEQVETTPCTLTDDAVDGSLFHLVKEGKKMEHLEKTYADTGRTQTVADLSPCH